MSINKKITPLSKFPTEALVMNYRRHRLCRTRMPWGTHRSYNNITYNWEYWVPVTGPFEIDGVVYNPCIIAYKKVTKQELKDHFTEIKGNIWICGKYGNDFKWTDEMEFTFEGMYWRGTIDEIKAEMANRPHTPLKGRKDFRRWKIKYKKSLRTKIVSSQSVKRIK